MLKSDETSPSTFSGMSDTEAEWYRSTYRGDSMPQLTVRAVLMGSVLGALMALSNLYVGLKTGISMGVSITACILSFAIYKSLMTLFPRLFKTEMSILENNCMQSTATSAGVSTGSAMVSSIPAYLIITGHHIPQALLSWWIFFLAAVGVFMAIPMKRQMVNVEQLRFPSGIATAETLKSLHSKGSEAVSKARSLGIAGAVGALIAWFRDAGKPFSIPESIPFPGAIMGIPMVKWTLSFQLSGIMIGAGAIMGWRSGWSMLFGAVLNYAVLAPWMVRLGAIDATKVGFRAIVTWSTWTGASMMVTAGLIAFAFQWRTIVSALSGMLSLFGKKPKTESHDPIAKIEVPSSWFISGTVISGLCCIGGLYFGFGTSIWMGILAVIMTFFLSVVACRVTGETDVTPIGAMGKITQLTFGTIAPSNILTNLMTAGLTAGAANSSADLLTDLKSGYILGANPRKQFIAQFLGIFTGVLVVIPAFYLIIPNAAALGTTKWPAPAAQVWTAVARLLSSGIHSLHPTAQWGIVIGGSVGIIFPILERLFPRASRYMPSATGIGLSMVIPFFISLSMFTGAFIAMILQKKSPKMAEEYIVPVSSGLIAGESLMGIAIALLVATGVIAG